MDIDYGYYGLTKDEATVRGIKVAEYLVTEMPEFYREVTHVPRDLEDMIERFELVWPMPFEEKYVESRKINEFKAFRELLQNALDAEHEVYGYEKIRIDVRVDNLGTHVVDRGKGITWRAFLMGGSDKPCYARGYFGEGLKLAGLRFSAIGHPVYLFTGRVVYKMMYYRPMDVFAIVFGRSRKDVKGTHVLIYRWRLPKWMLENMYVKKTPGLHKLCSVKFGSRDCEYDMPNEVYIDDSKDTKLYVRDIFVNTFRNMFGDTAFYTYNLWWVELDPNRTNVESSYMLDKEIKRRLTTKSQTPE